MTKRKVKKPIVPHPDLDDESKKILAGMGAEVEPEAPVAEVEPEAPVAEVEPEAPAAEVEPEAPAVEGKAPGNTLTNTGINYRRINGIDIAVGDDYVLSDSDLADDSLMAKVNRAVTLGVLARS